MVVPNAVMSDDDTAHVLFSSEIHYGHGSSSNSNSRSVARGTAKLYPLLQTHRGQLHRGLADRLYFEEQSMIFLHHPRGARNPA